MADALAPTLAPAPALPRLREDLRLMPGPAQPDGAPSWTLYDPAQHRYMRIGRLEFEILGRWALGDPARIAASIAADTTLRPGPEAMRDMLRFAARAHLLHPAGGAASLAAEAQARRSGPALWLLKNYLFLRLRLVDPDRLLAWLARRTDALFRPGSLVLLGVLALLGLFLVGRQWEGYTHSFLHLFTAAGAAQVALALAFAKAVHELGHGLAARRLGCRVPGMGVALLVLWPMLWTDVSDAWRLTDRRHRLMIDAAGVVAEIVLAVFASLAWAVLPDGAARSGAFLLSGSTWLVTLAVNLNPLMRFDGYYLLGDLIETPNLQERSFALARWRLRRLLFGLREEPPEALPARRALLLSAYAWGCWVYRFFLFFGIALLVYHLTFPSLGLFLMSVEIGWFILRPVAREVALWPGLARRGSVLRSGLSLALAAGVLAALALPWRGEVAAPAVLHAARQAELLAPAAGVLRAAVAEGTAVHAGEVLFRLEAPDAAHARDAALAEIAGLRARLAGQGFDADAAQDVPLAWQELQGAVARLRAAEAEQATLSLRAPFDGVVRDVPRALSSGAWLPRRERLGMLVAPDGAVVEALVGEADVARLRAGAAAWFRPEGAADDLALRVREIGSGAVAELDLPELASISGGAVAVRMAEGAMRPEAALYRVVLAPQAAVPATPMRRRGAVRIAATPASVLGRTWRRIMAVVLRESGL